MVSYNFQLSVVYWVFFVQFHIIHTEYFVLIVGCDYCR